MISSEAMEYLMASSSDEEEDNDSEEVFDFSDNSSEDDKEEEFNAIVCSMKHVMKDYNFTSDDLVIYDPVNLTYTVKNIKQIEKTIEEEKPRMKIIYLDNIFKKYKACKENCLQTSNSLFDKMKLLSNLVLEELTSAESTELLHDDKQHKLQYSPNFKRSKKRELRFKRLRACVKLIRKDYRNVVQNERGANGETLAQKVMLRNHKINEKKIMICLANPDIDLPNKALITKELGIKTIVDKSLRLEMASQKFKKSQVNATNDTVINETISNDSNSSTAAPEASDNETVSSSEPVTNPLIPETPCNAQPSDSESIILTDLSYDNSTTVTISNANSATQPGLLSPGTEDDIASETETATHAFNNSNATASSSYNCTILSKGETSNPYFEDISSDSDYSDAPGNEILSSPEPVVVTNSLIVGTQPNSESLKFPARFKDNSTYSNTVTTTTTTVVTQPEAMSSAVDDDATSVKETETSTCTNTNATAPFMYNSITLPTIEPPCAYANAFTSEMYSSKNIEIPGVSDKISQSPVFETTKKHLQDNESETICTDETIKENSTVNPANHAASINKIYNVIRSCETVSRKLNEKFLNSTRVLSNAYVTSLKKKIVNKTFVNDSKKTEKKSSTKPSTVEIFAPPDNHSANETIQSTAVEQASIPVEAENQLLPEPCMPSNPVLKTPSTSRKKTKNTISKSTKDKSNVTKTSNPKRKTECDIYNEIIQKAKNEIINYGEEFYFSDDNSCTLRTTRSCYSWNSTGSRYNLRSRSVCSYVISDDDFSDQDYEFTPKSSRSVPNLNVKPKRTYKKRNKLNNNKLSSSRDDVLQVHERSSISNFNHSIDNTSLNLTGGDTSAIPDAARLPDKDNEFCPETNGSVLNVSTKTKKRNKRKKKLKTAKPSNKCNDFICDSDNNKNVNTAQLPPLDMFLDLNANDILSQSLPGTDTLTVNTSDKPSASVDDCVADPHASFAESIPCPSDIPSQSLNNTSFDFSFEETDAQMDSTESRLSLPNLIPNSNDKKKPKKRLRLLSNFDDYSSESDNSQSKNISSCSPMCSNESSHNVSLDFNFGDTDSELNDIFPRSISEIYSLRRPVSNSVGTPSLRENDSNSAVSNKEPENNIQAHENVNIKNKSQTSTKNNKKSSKESKLSKRRTQIPFVPSTKGTKRKFLGRVSNKTLSAAKRKSASVQSENVSVNRNNIIDAEPQEYNHPCFDLENNTIYTSTPKRSSEQFLDRDGKNEKPRNKIKRRRLYNPSPPPKLRRNKTVLNNTTNNSNITEDNLNVLPSPEDSNDRPTNFEIAEEEISNLNVTNLNEPAIKFPVMKPQVKNVKENVTKNSLNVTDINLLDREKTMHTTDKTNKSAVNVSNTPLSKAERLSHPERKVVRNPEHEVSPNILASNAANCTILHPVKSRLLYPDNYMEKFRDSQINKADVPAIYNIGHKLYKKQIGSSNSENRKAKEGNVTDKIVNVTNMVQEQIAGCDVLKKFDTDNVTTVNFDGLVSVNSEIREDENNSRLSRGKNIQVDEPSLGVLEQFEEVNRALAVSQYISSLSPERALLQDENKVLDMCHRNGYIITLRKEQVSFFKWRTGSMLQKGSYIFKGSIGREIQPRNHFLEQRTNHTSYNPKTRVVSFFQIFINQADSKATVFIYTCGPRVLPSKPSKFLIKLDSCLLLSVVYTVIPTDFQFTIGYTLLDGKQPFELKIFMHDPKSILPKVIRLPNIERACSHLDVVNLSLNEEEKRYMIAGYAAGRLTVWNFEKQQIYLRMAEPILLNEIPTNIPDILTKGQCAWMSICLDDEGIEEPIAYIVLWDQIKRHLYLVSIKFNHEYKIIKKQDVQRQYQNLISITFGNAILCAIFKEGTLIFNWSKENGTTTLLQKLPGEIFGRGHTVIFNNLSTRSMNDIDMEHFILYNNNKLCSGKNKSILNGGS